MNRDVQKSRTELDKQNSENHLLNIRISSLSEILTLQEAEVTKVNQLDRVACTIHSTAS